MSCDACNSVGQAQQDNLQFQIQIALQKKSLDAAKQQGAAVLELLQSAAQLSKAAGKGDAFDSLA